MEIVERFFNDADKCTQALSDKATHLSYREFLNFFKFKEVLTEHDIIIGAYFTYGWMPTMLDLRGDLTEVTTIANSVKNGVEIDQESFMKVAIAINGSAVGASKLLHFINPETHAIWDSRVYRYIHQNEPHDYRIKSPPAYWSYLETLDLLSKDKRFPNVKKHLETMIGYEVTAKRAAELVMFYNGAKILRSD